MKDQGKKNPSKAVVCGFLWVLLGLNLRVLLQGQP